MRGHFIKSAVITGIIILAGLFAVTKLSYLSWRINSTEVKMYSGEQDDQNGLAIRLLMWKTAVGLIKDRPLAGYGLKGARVETLKKYKETGFKMGYERGWHTHNQYLESALMAGIPAMVLLVALMLIALLKGIRKNNLLLILIVFHFIIQSLFEATFEVQHELVFYIFFIFLFYYHAPAIHNAERT
jgi:O-antigen ligase